MSVIHILPEAVANKIAAGEVVERPASVVKELVENSLDAGATRVDVAVESGGKRLIRVVDDGCGMSHDDALLAFERHATSKIRSADDLFEVSTLGFRGEALPSIAAVSRLALETRHASEAAGTRIEIAGGRLRDVKAVAWPSGTSIEARDLFFNTPARRKFLKSESTELGHVATLATHYALAHPERSFRLTSLTHEILNVAPVTTSRERVYQVMGNQLLEQLVEITPREREILISLASTYGFGAPEAEDNAEPEPAARVRVSGFVSRPEVEKLNRNSIYFFVNRRLVRDRLILHAITEAYRNILPAGVFPVALIFLELPAAEVDVNVHPSKIEVRFRHGAFVHDFVRDAIRQALMETRPVATFPISRRDRLARAEEDAELEERLAGEPAVITHSPEVAPSEREAPPNAALSGFKLSAVQPPPQSGRFAFGEAGGPSPMSTGIDSGPPAALPSSDRATSVMTTAADDVSRVPARLDEFPVDLRPLGQVEESFIVATNAEGLWIIDQHVAHERVLFERHLRLRREKKVEGQRLLLPIIVELQPEQQATFQNIAEELAANGFEVEPFGQRTVAIKTAPADIRSEDVQRLLVEILDGVGPEARAVSLDELRSKIAASVACHAAIKINMALEPRKMEWLLRELGRTQYPMTCPHGRPIVLRYSMRDIQKAFKRL